MGHEENRRDSKEERENNAGQEKMTQRKAEEAMVQAEIAIEKRAKREIKRDRESNRRRVSKREID